MPAARSPWADAGWRSTSSRAAAGRARTPSSSFTAWRQAGRSGPPWLGGWALGLVPCAWSCRGAATGGGSGPWRPLDRFTAVAHSFAGTALLAYLDRYGDGLLENIVCVCPFYQDAVEKFDWSTLVYFVDRFHGFLREGLVARQPSYAGRPTVDLMAARVQESIGPEGWLQFFGLFCRTPRLDLSHVERPALVLGGSEDIASRPRYSRELAAALPRAEVRILEGSGHFPMLQRPAEFTAVVEQFLSRHRRCRQRAGVLGSPGAAGPSHGKEVKSCR